MNNQDTVFLWRICTAIPNPYHMIPYHMITYHMITYFTPHRIKWCHASSSCIILEHNACSWQTPFLALQNGSCHAIRHTIPPYNTLILFNNTPHHTDQNTICDLTRHHPTPHTEFSTPIFLSPFFIKPMSVNDKKKIRSMIRSDSVQDMVKYVIELEAMLEGTVQDVQHNV